MAPTQARVITISEQNNGYAEKIYAELKKSQIRAEIDIGNKTLENKIREAILMKIPYIIVVGKKEEESGKITIRSRTGKQTFGIIPEEFIAKIHKEIETRSFTLSY
jgi:threonyl-tRNA synthetase